MSKKGESAEKAYRRSLRQQAVNGSRDRMVRTAVRTARTSVDNGTEDATEAVKRASITLDRAAARGTVHPNNAARRKSRLAKRLNKATAEA